MSGGNYFDLGSILQLQGDVVSSLPTNATLAGGQDTASLITGISQSLQGAFNNFKAASTSSDALLANQKDVGEIVSTELDRLKKKKHSVDAALEGQKRMLHLNDSYRAKHAYYNYIIIVLIAVFIVLIIFNFASMYFPNVPFWLFELVYVVLFSSIIIYFYILYRDINRRDKTNFNELDLEDPPKGNVDLSAKRRQAATEGDLLGSINITGCVGPQCCDPGTATWDEGNSVCIGKDGLIAGLTGGEGGEGGAGAGNAGLDSFSNMEVTGVLPNSPNEFENYSKI